MFSHTVFTSPYPKTNWSDSQTTIATTRMSNSRIPLQRTGIAASHEGILASRTSHAVASIPSPRTSAAGVACVGRRAMSGVLTEIDGAHPLFLAYLPRIAQPPDLPLATRCDAQRLPRPGGIRMPILTPFSAVVDAGILSSSTRARCSDRPGVTQPPQAQRRPFQS